jgi:hemoglobin
MRILGALACLCLIGCGSSKKPSTGPTPNNNVDSDATESASTDPATTTTPAPGPKGAKGSKTLFDRLGGQPAITAVVDEFVTRTTTDVRIKERFFNTDPVQLRKLLVEFVCMATGGPCKYTGRDMESSHAGMDLVEDEFNALVEDLVGALDKFKVPEKEKGELLGALGKMHDDIVTAK